jgi:hypothetical protein
MLEVCMGNIINKASSYVLNGRYIKNPIQFYLIIDSNFVAEQIKEKDAIVALNAALDTWNTALGKSAFLPIKVEGEHLDGISYFAWEDIGINTLAYSNSYCNENGMLERAEITFNSRAPWSVNPKNSQIADLQSAALHESGHNIGLGDLYSLPRTDPRRRDLRQVMNYVAGIKRTLGLGDKAGARKTLIGRA